MVNSVLGMQSCWEQSIVIYIVEEIYGTEALMPSAYLSSGTESCGVLSILVFFVGVLYLRFPLYAITEEVELLYRFACSARGT